jgi:hypothetical protein
MLLHLSLFLFFGGLAIFLFEVDHEVFSYVIWWIGLFCSMYGFITLLPIIRHNSPYHSPLSTPAWFLYAGIHHATFKILAFITRYQTTWRYERLRDRYQGWVLGGVEKAAEETASKRSSEVDVQILDWTISALGDDDSLKRFFEAIPGFFSSKLVEHLKRDLPVELVEKFRDAVGGFLIRSWSSDSVDDSEKVRRLDISLNAMDQITNNRFVVRSIFYKLRNEVPRTVEMGHTLAHWFTNNDEDIPAYAQRIIAGVLVNVLERNDSWVTLATRTFGLPERDLWDNVALGGDNVLLATLIHVTRQYLRSDYYNKVVVETLSKFDIRNTLPRLQHDFCTLWNEIVQKARDQGFNSTPIYFLKEIRHLYIALHQGADAAPTAFSDSTDNFDPILYESSSYPFCTLASHRTDSTSHVSLHLPTQPGNSPDASSPPPTDGGNTASRQAEQVNYIIEPPSSSNPTTTNEIGATSHGHDMTPPSNLVHSSSYPTSAPSTAVVAAAPQDVTSAATLSHPLEGSEQQDADIIARPGTSQNLSTASAHASTLTLALIPTILPNTPSESYDAGVASVSHSAPPSIRSSIPASRPAGGATLPRLRARGLVNTRNMCFANTVLQLLVKSPPFWNLFRELGDLKGQHRAGVPEAGGGATPLVDATVRFIREFILEEESPSIQQATRGTTRADKGKKGDNVVDSFEPIYLYDAMKEKRRLKSLLVRSRAHAAAYCY